MLAALLLVSVLATGSDGIVPAVTSRLRPRRSQETRTGAAAQASQRGDARAAQALAKRFGDLVAVRGVDIELRSQAVVALIGPNGSGKTTVLRLLAGTLPPDGGRVALDGRALADTAADERASSSGSSARSRRTRSSPT